MQRRSILLFEAWSISQIANEINVAVSGMGTDEEKLLNAISQLADRQSVVSLNQLMTGSDKYTYKTIADVINGELGYFDEETLKKIMDHLTKIGADDLTSMLVLPPTPPEKVIADILPRVKQHEGVKPKVYRDSAGIPTVGVGFNLTRQDSVQRLKDVGANYVKIKSGQAALTDEQMSKLLIQDLTTAQQNAQALIQNWNSLPASVQGVLIEMAFNLGKRGLSEFKNFLSYVNSYNFPKAADEMLNSAWARQVGTRAKTLSNIIRQA